MFVRPETGERYRVRLTPRERVDSLGVDKRRNGLVFETALGEWVGSVPVYPTVTLWTLAEEDLVNLLGQAARRGLLRTGEGGMNSQEAELMTTVWEQASPAVRDGAEPTSIRNVARWSGFLAARR